MGDYCEQQISLLLTIIDNLKRDKSSKRAEQFVRVDVTDVEQ